MPTGTVYARYGTQSAEGADAYNSIEGLKTTMERVLELHANYPENADQLKDKRGADKPYRTALEMPGLRNKDRYRQLTSRANCVHCHNIHDAENFELQKSDDFSHAMLWRYPLPDNIGLKIDAKNGRQISEVVAGVSCGRCRAGAGRRGAADERPGNYLDRRHAVGAAQSAA